MASGKISVFATTAETSLPILFSKIEKEKYEMAVTDVFSKGIYKSPSLSSADRCQLFYLGHQYTLQQPLLVGHRTEVVRI